MQCSGANDAFFGDVWIEFGAKLASNSKKIVSNIRTREFNAHFSLAVKPISTLKILKFVLKPLGGICFSYWKYKQ